MSAAAALATGCVDDVDDAVQVIGPEGGTISSKAIEVTIPEGALTEEIEVKIRTVSGDLSAGDYVQVRDAVALFPQGTELIKPMKVRLLPKQEDPAVLFDFRDRRVVHRGKTFFTTEFSRYALAKAGEEAVRLKGGKSFQIDPERIPADRTFTNVADLTVEVDGLSAVDAIITAHDVEDAYERPINGNGDIRCAFQFRNLSGGSLNSGCADTDVTARLGVTADEMKFDLVPYLSGKLDTDVLVSVVIGDDDLSYWLGYFRFNTSPCFEETCGGQGVCDDSTGEAVCTCNDGFQPSDEEAEPLACVCAPQCEGRECGRDGCGGFCGDGCAADEFCDNDVGRCEPEPVDDEGDGNNDDDSSSSTTDGGSTDDGMMMTTDSGGDDSMMTGTTG